MMLDSEIAISACNEFCNKTALRQFIHFLSLEPELKYELSDSSIKHKFITKFTIISKWILDTKDLGFCVHKSLNSADDTDII